MIGIRFSRKIGRIDAVARLEQHLVLFEMGGL